VKLPDVTPDMVERWQIAEPFPHLVLDGAFGSDICDQAASEFPPPDDTGWHTFSGDLEYGKQEAKADIAGPAVKFLHLLFESFDFVLWVSSLTLISDLQADPLRLGGGIHQVREDGRLGLHVDYNLHPSGLERRVNTILFVEHNPWPGADLILYRDGFSRAVTPAPDRLVVFEAGDDTWHGHPHPLEPPTRHQTRKSIPSYLFAPARPGVVARSTQFLEQT
jgi:hypothetical protein